MMVQMLIVILFVVMAILLIVILIWYVWTEIKSALRSQKAHTEKFYSKKKPSVRSVQIDPLQTSGSISLWQYSPHMALNTKKQKSTAAKILYLKSDGLSSEVLMQILSRNINKFGMTYSINCFDEKSSMNINIHMAQIQSLELGEEGKDSILLSDVVEILKWINQNIPRREAKGESIANVKTALRDKQQLPLGQKNHSFEKAVATPKPQGAEIIKTTESALHESRNNLRGLIPIGAKGFAVFYLETTGFTQDSRVVEVAVVFLNTVGVVTDEWETLVNPGIQIPSTYTKIHHIDESLVVGAPSFPQIAGQLSAKLHGHVLVTHNLEFYLPILKANYSGVSNIDICFGQGICTLLGLKGNIAKKRLQDLCESNSIDFDETVAHTAIGKARHLSKVLIKGLPHLIPSQTAVDVRGNESLFLQVSLKIRGKQNWSLKIGDERFSMLKDFITDKIELRTPNTDEEFKILIERLRIPSDKGLGLILNEIHQAWNLGVFKDFREYKYLDELIWYYSKITKGLFIKPCIFTKAQEDFTAKQGLASYREKLLEYQYNLKDAGGYQNLLKREIEAKNKLQLEQEEKKKREQEAIIQKEEKRRVNEAKKKEERLFRLNAIKELIPSCWNTKPNEISEKVGQSVTIDEIEEVKIEIIKKWFLSKNLEIPSNEQAAVISNCQNSLKVIARAGSGKTRTIAQKMIFLTHFLGYHTDEIITLVFNTKARAELQKRIKDLEEQADLPSRGQFKILTFDQLAYHLVKPREKILSDAEGKKLIKEVILNALDNEENLRQQVEELMVKSFKSDFDKIIRINSMSSKADLDHLRSFITEETLDGKEVKSKPEKRIADFLFEHNIPYIYEMPFIDDNGEPIRPDFYITTQKIVVEYYGMRGDSEYEKSIEYKRNYWNKRSDIILIEIDPEFICVSGQSFDNTREEDYKRLAALLTEKTRHLNDPLTPKRLTDEEIITKLRDRIRLTFAELVQSAITRAGQLHCSYEDFLKRLDAYNPSFEEERLFLELLPKLFVMYKDRLINNNFTDFNEIKAQAIMQMNNGKTKLYWDKGGNGIDLKSVKYCFVDEFQDFSELFRGLLLAILKISPKALVNAVGDDWQMINRFAGSMPQLFENFDRDYPSPKTVYLKTNYRSASGIVDFCNQIMKSNGVFGQQAISPESHKSKPCIIRSLNRDLIDKTPREDHFFKGDSTLSSIFRIYKPLTERYQIQRLKEGDNICLAISRSKNPPLQVQADDLGLRALNKLDLINNIVSRLTNTSASKYFEAITCHKSKGLEADSVIILQPRNFPTIHKRSLFLQFFGDTPCNLLRDELNIFYVACSRAKSELYFLPERGYMMSPFLEKIRYSIKNSTWDNYPCRLKGPESLYTILVQNGNKGRDALYNARHVLIAHGFEKFSRPNHMPTRNQLIRKDLFNTLLFLEQVVQACSEFDLKYIVKDGLNKDVFCTPGTKSIEQAKAESQGPRPIEQAKAESQIEQFYPWD